jgi:hypothetical protein
MKSKILTAVKMFIVVVWYLQIVHSIYFQVLTYPYHHPIAINSVSTMQLENIIK